MDIPHVLINPSELMRYNGAVRCPNCGGPLERIRKADRQVTDQHWNLLNLDLFTCQESCDKPFTMSFWQPDYGRMAEAPETCGWVAVTGLPSQLKTLVESTNQTEK